MTRARALVTPTAVSNYPSKDRDAWTGSNVFIETVVDGMHCRVDGVLGWQLQIPCIGDAEDVFT